MLEMGGGFWSRISQKWQQPSPYRPAHLCPNSSRMGMMTLGKH